MPRGRHRISPPLHRLLPPLTVAGAATAVAVAAWFSPIGDNALVPRVLVALAAAVACWSALLLRRWDRAAGKQVADLKAARVRDEWHSDERVAELESDVEESRAIRKRLEAELRAKRAELTGLRGEHAALLRRYATAESERARALESRRRLAIEASAPPRALDRAARPVSPAAYHQALEALRNLSRNAARQQAPRTADTARRQEPGDAGDEPHGRHAGPPAAPAPAPTAAQPPVPQPRAALPVREHRLVPAVSAAVLPYAQPRRPVSRTQGGFDYFGAHKTAATHDLADVVGDEAYEASRRRPADDESEVIDLTAHDDTEQLDVRELRARS